MGRLVKLLPGGLKPSLTCFLSLLYNPNGSSGGSPAGFPSAFPAGSAAGLPGGSRAGVAASIPVGSMAGAVAGHPAGSMAGVLAAWALACPVARVQGKELLGVLETLPAVFPAHVATDFAQAPLQPRFSSAGLLAGFPSAFPAGSTAGVPVGSIAGAVAGIPVGSMAGAAVGHPVGSMAGAAAGVPVGSMAGVLAAWALVCSVARVQGKEPLGALETRPAVFQDRAATGSA